MEVTIEYSGIIDRCKMLAAFEGREAIDGSGEGLYDKVKITEKDEVAIKVYIEQGGHIIEAVMCSIVDTDYTYNGSNIVITINEDESRRNPKGFRKAVSEALVSYAMHRWLENKIPTSSASYKGMFDDLQSAAIKIIKTKRVPKRPQ